jgi:hypothetical protein
MMEQYENWADVELPYIIHAMPATSRTKKQYRRRSRRPMPTKKPKPFFDMTPAQKEALVRRLDRGLSPDQLKPLSPGRIDAVHFLVR